MRFKLFVAACAAALAVGHAHAQQFNPSRSPIAPDGIKAVIDLPPARHIKNVGGSDGAGLCVFTSVQHSADWQNVRTLDGFREWMRKRPGGGWPAKLDQMLARFCAERGVSVPQYIQHTGGDESFLELALQTDRFPAVTYSGLDDFYRDRFNQPARIAHMVNLAHLDDKWAAIVDNNRPGVWVWMSRRDFLARWRDNDGGWAVVLLGPPPPPHREGGTFGSAPCVCGDCCTCLAGTCPGKCPTAFGQCPNGRCGVPVVFPPVGTGRRESPPPIGAPPTPEHEWRQFPTGEWGWRFKVEVPPPAVADLPENYGVDSKRIHSHPAYSINGTEVTRRQALEAIGAAGLADDRANWHLSLVGDPEFVRRVRADLETVVGELRGKLHVQAYAPGEWPVELFGLPRGVSLRKPSPARVAAEVGAVAPEEYSAARLAGLFALPGGPNHRPAPPEPKPDPKPTPAPNNPLEPAPPGPAPNPAPGPPPAPLSVPLDAGLIAFVVALVVMLFSRRK